MLAAILLSALLATATLANPIDALPPTPRELDVIERDTPSINLVLYNSAVLIMDNGTALFAPSAWDIYSVDELQDWTLQNGARCHLEVQNGQVQQLASFMILDGPDYLSPCGWWNGARVVCTGPEATCVNPYNGNSEYAGSG